MNPEADSTPSDEPPPWRAADALAHMAHDLRSPLNVMQGSAQLIRTDVQPGSEIAEAADEILRASRQMTRMLDELHDVARIEAGALHLESQCLPVAPLVDRAVADALTQCDDRGIERAPVGATAGLFVRGDRAQLRSALVKVLITAVRHNRGSAPLQVRVLAHGAQGVAVVVAPAPQRGALPGAPAQRLPGDDAPSRVLAEMLLAGHVLRMMGGRLRARRLDDGAWQFTVVLQRAAEPAAAPGRPGTGATGHPAA